MTGGKILWVTNFAAPYRLPVWREMSTHFELEVGILERDGGAHHWSMPPDENVVELKGWKLNGDPRIKIISPSRLPIEPVSAVVVCGWDHLAYWQVALWARRRGARVIVLYESTLASHRVDRGPIAMLRSRFLRGADAVVTVGAASTDAVMQMGVTHERIFEGFNAVDVEAFRTDAIAFRRQQPPVNGRGHRFVYVGRLAPEKNLEALLRAFASIAEADDLLTLVGAGDQERTLRITASALGISPEFTGYLSQEETIAVMAASQTLVLPSTWEAWGLVVNEALAAGLQVVVTEACGVASSVADMRGVYVTGCTEAALAAGLAESRRQWGGYIAEPAIVTFTPKRFAGVIGEAINGANNSGMAS